MRLDLCTPARQAAFVVGVGLLAGVATIVLVGWLTPRMRDEATMICAVVATAATALVAWALTYASDAHGTATRRGFEVIPDSPPKGPPK